jgi:[ribosomal protein S18]-alanine N-acetyltransferase
MERGHAEALGPMVERLLLESKTGSDRLTRIIVTYGPGTFTGLRIGLSYAKGMALALGIPLVGLNSLKATAQHTPDKVLIAHKAGGTGLYYWTSPGGPALGSLSEINANAQKLGRPVIGSGLEGERSFWPDAKVFAGFAASLPVTGQNIEPLYLRAPDAKPSVSATSATPHVRRASVQDIETLASIHQQSFETGWDATALNSILSVPGADAMVVELSGTIYGFVQFQWVAGEAEINTLCVLPSYRRQNFGSDLLQGLITELQHFGTSKLFLDVAEDNAAALALYSRFGFQRTGLRKRYYSNGRDAVTMVKDLAA